MNTATTHKVSKFEHGSAFVDSSEYRHGSQETLGILLVNLGSPQSPTARGLKKYLRQFLSDRRVIEAPRILWWCILNFKILPRRSVQSAALYRKIWTRQGSPLIFFSIKQQKQLQKKLAMSFPFAQVTFAMSYGEPSIKDALLLLKKKGMTKLLVLPLYPQYASSTVGSVFEAVTKELSLWRRIPDLRSVHSYHDHPLFIKTLANSIKEFWKIHGKPRLLIFSFHGIPFVSLLQGDPYHCHCHKTARLVAQELKLPEHAYRVCFQSRFGKQPWLQPYTDKTLMKLPGEGIESVQIICPGFSSDCLETLEEICVENRTLFLNAGGKTFDYIPCLNDSPAHISFLSELVKENITGWSERLKEINQITQRKLSQALAQKIQKKVKAAQ